MSIKPKSYVQVIVDGEEGSAEILSQLWELSTKLLIAMRDSDLPIEICPDVAFLTYARITAMVDAHDQKGVDLHWLNSVGAERQEMFRGFYLLQQQLGQVTRGEATKPKPGQRVLVDIVTVRCPCGKNVSYAKDAATGKAVLKHQEPACERFLLDRPLAEYLEEIRKEIGD